MILNKDLESKKEALLLELCNYISKKETEILGLKDNWDGNNAKKYELETFRRATAFLKSLVEDFWLLFNYKLESPLILPGINGEIDIEWKNDKFQLLISIPEDESELAGLYGSDYEDDEIEHDFLNYGDVNIRLLAWLKRQIR